MKDVKLLIEQRDATYQHQTIEIMNTIAETIIGVEEALLALDPTYLSGIFVWENVMVYEEVLLLTGVVQYDAGTEFDTGEEVITITEHNKEHFMRDIRAGIPLSVVRENNSSAVFKFLSEISDNDIFIGTPEELQETFEGGNYTTTQDGDGSLPTLKPSIDPDFDLSELSEEQIRLLEAIDDKGTIN